MRDNYLLPRRTHDRDGGPRRAGFEFEFGNLPIAETASALQMALGGSVESISPFEAVLHHSALGRLKIERDADLLKSTRYRKTLESLGIEFTPGSVAHDIETNIDNASRMLVPCEVVTDPIAFADLGLLDQLVATLNALGAEGTQESIIYAFGLHINPSLPTEDSVDILRFVQAFLLLHGWLVETAGTDRTRRYLTPYIDPFPQQYLERVLDSGYRPDTGELIDDYLEFNPTRNRALDMLPILTHLDAERVMAALPADERRLVKGRPAFHYRLPDCKINVPGWSVATPWNHWVYIEKLAEDEALLTELISAWQIHYSEFRLAQNSRWIQQLSNIIVDRFFASV